MIRQPSSDAIGVRVGLFRSKDRGTDAMRYLDPSDRDSWHLSTIARLWQEDF